MSGSVAVDDGDVVIRREVWSSSENPMKVEIRKYAKLGHLIGPRLVVDYLPGLREVSFDVVNDYDTVGIRISAKMARRLARFILDNIGDKEPASDDLPDQDAGPGEDGHGKRQESTKEEPTEVSKEEA